MALTIKSIQDFIKKIFTSSSFASFLFALILFMFTDANLINIELLKIIIELTAIVGIAAILSKEIINIISVSILAIAKLTNDIKTKNFEGLPSTAKDTLITEAKDIVLPLLTPIVEKSIELIKEKIEKIEVKK